MNKLKRYRVAHKGLKEGSHSFRFVLDRDFFDCFKATEGREGELAADVEIVKHGSFIEVKMRLEGLVKATCDRCLDEMELPLSGEMKVLLKQGDQEAGNEDDFIVLPPGEDYIDLGPLLYEMFMLHYPLRVVHPDGGCAPEMESVLGEFVINEKVASDPRWDELKRLINN
ncbi:MAG: DUF177 domain-containing protein [Odoribacteraceae bacterium]|nr:DUF177 domain-containing protein [Odoribacteraceae bacterium]